jgi:hypothetical protein
MKRTFFCLVLILMLFELNAQGAFNIETFTDPTRYGWQNWEDRMNYRYDLFERQKLLQIYEIDAQTTSGNVLKSAVFPGWGQFNTKQYTKGQIFMAIEIGLLGASYFFYDRSQLNYDKYKEATQIDEINKYYQDALIPYQYSMVFLTFATVVWAYNLFDVVQTTEKYNSDVWKKTLKAYYNSPVQITPDGVQIKF